jgi:hypothetical protein
MGASGDSRDLNCSRGARVFGSGNILPVPPGVVLADAEDSLPKSHVAAGATANDSSRHPRKFMELTRDTALWCWAQMSCREELGVTFIMPSPKKSSQGTTSQ